MVFLVQFNDDAKLKRIRFKKKTSKWTKHSLFLICTKRKDIHNNIIL